MSKEFTKSYAINRIAELNEQIVEMTDNQNQTMRYLNRIRDENNQLKQQLAEKNIRIEELESQFAYECECNMQLVDLQKQLEEKQKTIDEINREFVQAVHDWKTLCAEKDKEIEKLKQELEETNAGYDFTYEQSTETIKELKQNQTQLAIQELEKAFDYIEKHKHKTLQDDRCVVYVKSLKDQIDQQIKELRR